MLKMYTLHVTGTHCASCKILIEDVLGEQEFIKKAQVDLKKEIVEIETDSDKRALEIAEILTIKLKPNGYSFFLEKIIKSNERNNVIWKALPIGLVFLVLFFLLQKSGVLNLGIGGEITWTTSFIIGIIASLSTCLAIVGGLVLSLSAKVVQDEGSRATKKPFILFHAGRLVGFAVLGGVLGLIGEAIGVNFLFSAILGLLASAVMIMLGMNLLGIFKKNKMPKLEFAKHEMIEKDEHVIKRYPNLSTVLMVEDYLKVHRDIPLKIFELKKKLPKQIMH